MFEELFNIDDLAAYLQVEPAELNPNTVELLRDLAGEEIINLIGKSRFLARGAQRFRRCALEFSRQQLTNPEGLRSEIHSVDDYSETRTYAIETTQTLDELGFDRCVRRAAGFKSAFSIAVIEKRGAAGGR